MNATDDMSGVNTTYWRIDGGAPQIYTEPFNISIDGQHKIEYRSVDYAGNVEDWKSVEFKADQTPPTIELTWESWNQNGIWEILFTATCSDATSGMDRVEFFIEDVCQFTDYAEPYEWMIEWNTSLEGSSFYAYAYDIAGNDDVGYIPGSSYYISSDIYVFQRLTFPNNYDGYIGILISPLVGSTGGDQIWKSNSRNDDDTTPPVTTIYFDPPTPTGENGWYVDDVEINLEATDDMSGVDFIKYLLDDNDWLTYTSPLIIESDGYHRITYYAVDKAGNVEQPSEVSRFKIDRTDPQIEEFVIEPYRKNWKWYVTFTVKCSDAMSGMDRVEFYINDGLAFTDDEEPYEWTIEWTSALETAMFKATAYDVAGNYDYAGPEHIPDESINGLIYNPEFSRQNVGPSLLPSTGSIVAEKYVSTDNQIYESNSRNDDDTTPPVTTISFDPLYPDGDNGWYVSDVTITLEATDDMSGVDVIKYLLDDSDWLTYTGPFTVESDGCHGITYYAIDKAGNVEQPSEVIRFGIDQTPPTIDLTWDVSGDDLIFTATCSDATSGMDRVEFYINDVLALVDDTPPYVWIIDYLWPYTFKVTAFDTAGNSAFVIIKDSDIHSYSSQSAEIVEKSSMYVGDLERTIVSETFLDPPCYLVLDGTMGENGWYVSCVMISFVYDPEEIAAVCYNIDSGSWQIYTAPFEACWDGEHTFCWYYIDKEGNQSAIECIEIKIDRIPPEINLTWDPRGRDYILFTAICSDACGIDRVEFALNDIPVCIDKTEPYEWLMYYWFLFTYTYKATAFDNAGNSAFDILEDSDIYSYSNSQSSSSQQSSSSSSSQSSKNVIQTTGTEIVENKNAETLISNLGLRGAELEVTTDKDVYDPGETVTIYLTNIGDEILYGGGPLITIYNEDDEIIFEEATYCWHELEPEEYITWTWDQTDQQGSQVPNGFYVVEGALYGVGETFVDSSIIAVTEEDLVVHIDGIEGENGWYISCVTITVLYDPEAIKEVYVNGEIYLEPVVICEDGEHDVEITAVDWDGNWMSPMSICFWIDKTPPWIDLTWEASGNNIIGWKVKWTATCSDAMSGMDGVYFRINNVVQFTDYEAPYEWVIEWSSVLEGVMFSATAFDNAGNSAWEWAMPSRDSITFKQSKQPTK